MIHLCQLIKFAEFLRSVCNSHLLSHYWPFVVLGNKGAKSKESQSVKTSRQPLDMLMNFSTRRTGLVPKFKTKLSNK